MEAPDIIYTDGKNTCTSAPVFSNIDGNIKYIRADLVEPLSVINALPEETKDMCSGCTNVKGCVTCVDGNMKEFAEDKNLEKAAEAYATESAGWNPDGTEKYQVIQEEVYAFKAGAEWQRERMLENAVECDVYGHCSGWLTFEYVPECDFDFKPGDKVKLIIIKEEEK